MTLGSTSPDKLRVLHIEPMKDVPVMTDRVAELIETLGSSMTLVMIAPSTICTATAGYKITTTTADVIEAELGATTPYEEDEIDMIEREIDQDTQVIVTPEMVANSEVIRPRATPPDIVFEQIEAELRDLIPTAPNDRHRSASSEEKSVKEGPTDASAPLRFDRSDDGLYDLGDLYILVPLINVLREIALFHQKIDDFIGELERRETDLRDEKTARVHEMIDALTSTFASKTAALRASEERYTATYVRLSGMLQKALAKGNAILADKIRRLLIETQHHLLNARETYRDILVNYTEGLKLLM